MSCESNLVIISMVHSWLVANDYDGLYCDGCGCSVDDLWPCSNVEAMLTCRAGYKVAGCQNDCGEGCDFHIVAEKPE